MSEKTIDVVRLGNSKEQDKSRFQQIQEERINSNFRKLNEGVSEMNVNISNINEEITEIQKSIDGISSDGNVITVDHPVDIVPRRAYATLSSAGWYRVLVIDDGTLRAFSNGYPSLILSFKIMTSRGTNNRTEEHQIQLFKGSNYFPFMNETSSSYNLWVDKIRHQYHSADDYCAVDIHFIGTSATNVTVCIDVAVDPNAQKYCEVVNLTSVADAPTGEQELSKHTFAANGSNNCKTLNCDKTVTSGFCQVTDSAITASSRLLASMRYGGGSYLMGVFLICQPQSGYANVYVRTGSGGLPSDNSKILFDLLIDNR